MRLTLCASTVALFLPAFAFAFSSGGQPGMTGAPGEGSCGIGGACHVANTMPGSFEIVVPAEYSPGETLDVQVLIAETGRSGWGFNLTAVDFDGFAAGQLLAGGSDTQYTFSGSLQREYIGQTSEGSCAFLPCPDSQSWTFPWIAPDPAPVGGVTFYACGVSGYPFDVYLTSTTISEAEVISVPSAEREGGSWSRVKTLFR